MVKRQIKRKAIADGLIVDPATVGPTTEWDWASGAESGTVRAHTRSEARHLIKAKLGLRKKDRLPVDSIIVKIEGKAS